MCIAICHLRLLRQQQLMPCCRSVPYQRNLEMATLDQGSTSRPSAATPRAGTLSAIPRVTLLRWERLSPPGYVPHSPWALLLNCLLLWPSRDSHHSAVLKARLPQQTNLSLPQHLPQHMLPICHAVPSSLCALSNSVSSGGIPLRNSLCSQLGLSFAGQPCSEACQYRPEAQQERNGPRPSGGHGASVRRWHQAVPAKDHRGRQLLQAPMQQWPPAVLRSLDPDKVVLCCRTMATSPAATMQLSAGQPSSSALHCRHNCMAPLLLHG